MSKAKITDESWKKNGVHPKTRCKATDELYEAVWAACEKHKDVVERGRTTTSGTRTTATPA